MSVDKISAHYYRNIFKQFYIKKHTEKTHKIQSLKNLFFCKPFKTISCLTFNFTTFQPKKRKQKVELSFFPRFMNSSLPPMNEIIQMVKQHKEKQEKWEAERETLQAELSVLTGKKTAWDLCRRDLEEQIYNLQISLGIMGNGGGNEVSTETNSNIPLSSQRSTPESDETTDNFVRPTHKTEFQYKFKHCLTIHLDCIRAITFYPSSPLVVTASDDGTMRVINLEPKSVAKRKVRRPPQNICSLRGHPAPVLCLATLSSGGDPWMVSGALDGSTCVWQLPRNDVTLYDVHGIITHNQMYNHQIHTDAVWSVDTFGTNAITTSADGTLKTWDIFLGTPKEINTCGKPLLCKVCDANHFLVACENDTIQYFENFIPSNQMCLKSGKEITALAISPNDKLAIIGYENGDIKIISYPKLDIVKEIVNVHTHSIASLSLTPCGDFFISCCSDGKVKAWSLQNFEEKSIGKDEKENHLTKYGEGALCAAPSGSCAKSYFATGGADGALHIFLHD
ncbi:hypothetical protein TRFO_35841 [Tritrichomonas foetus]|uniref:Uncharacterized protein n=1 Tax=Tritrichomonas foetus TaxID=1144522 RepID=A0A1J4JKT5_9EUKA|nr:hypothetical protein TRFO_35841 [Tritrichomonas foetus]|eukprot:OHS97876.1 hypothetical protein TRFO_35841 [Tritrichomonas foetus]